mmetsp:Transcript_67178/g.122650  ORF Transcript_67178/g.122650 Transcript_67178/m.122650 type:complete len:148 (+) Transcript_67178:78-521(+)
MKFSAAAAFMLLFVVPDIGMPMLRAPDATKLVASSKPRTPGLGKGKNKGPGMGNNSTHGMALDDSSNETNGSEPWWMSKNLSKPLPEHDINSTHGMDDGKKGYKDTAKQLKKEMASTDAVGPQGPALKPPAGNKTAGNKTAGNETKE